MDYSKGEPLPNPVAQSTDKSTNDLNGTSKRGKDASFIIEVQKLADLEEEKDQDSSDSDNPIPPLSKSNHVLFKIFPRESIEDLRNESKSLLASQRIQVNTSKKTLIEKESLQASATLLDLGTEDKQRVGRLIEELVLTYDKINEMKDILKRAVKNENKYKQKCSDLMKKIDMLGERCKKLEDDRDQIEGIKRQYLSRLTILQDKITAVSDKFGMSEKEIQKLKDENIQIKSEVNLLRTDKLILEAKVKSAEKKYKLAKSQLKVSMDREKKLRNVEVRQQNDVETQEDMNGTNGRLIKIPDNLSNPIIQTPTSIVQLKSPTQNMKEVQSTSGLLLNKSNVMEGLEEKETAILQDLFFPF